MMRLGSIALATVLSLLPIRGIASQSANRGCARQERDRTIQLAELREESIPAQDLATPDAQSSPGAVASPAAATDENSDSAEDSSVWKEIAPGQPAPDLSTLPVSNPVPAAAPPQAPAVNPADVPAIDAGSIATTPQVSDQPLTNLIDTAPTPARAASLRITEHERVEMQRDVCCLV